MSGPIVALSSSVTINDTSLTPTYAVSPNVNSVNEGSTVTYTVTTTNVANGTTLYWTNAGTAAADFSDASNSGSFTINNNSGTITRTLTSDLTTEGSETIIIEIRTGSTSGTIVATSSTVTVNDTSVETYAVSPNVSSVNEGGSVTWTITTGGVPNGTTLYWTNAGTTTAADFSDSSNSGSFTISANSGTITRTLTNDLTTEGSETIIIQIRTASTSGTVVATSSTVTVNDTSVPTYAVSPSVSSVNEGSSVTWTITTAGVPNGTTLYWTNAGTTVGADFTGGANSGSFTINTNNGSFSLTLSNDLTTEGSQTIIIQIRTGSTSGTIVATSSTVTVNDTSVETYAVSPSASSVNEGSSLTWTVTTGGVPNGTTLYWTNAGTTTAADFSDATNSGSFTINTNSGTISKTLFNDLALEGSETIIIQIRTGSTSGTIVATSSTVTVNDTSVPTYSVTRNVNSVNEGGTVTYTVTTAGVPNGTTLYWTNSGTSVASDFSDSANSGSFTINSNSGSFTRTLTNDSTTEGSETLIIQIRTGSTSGTVVATAASVTINDTSQTYLIEYIAVGGGGGGGNSTYCSGGGGGGGGAVKYGSKVGSPGTVVGIAIAGGGGAGATSSPGGASTFTCLSYLNPFAVYTGGGGAGSSGVAPCCPGGMGAASSTSGGGATGTNSSTLGGAGRANCGIGTGVDGSPGGNASCYASGGTNTSGGGGGAGGPGVPGVASTSTVSANGEGHFAGPGGPGYTWVNGGTYAGGGGAGGASVGSTQGYAGSSDGMSGWGQAGGGRGGMSPVMDSANYTGSFAKNIPGQGCFFSARLEKGVKWTSVCTCMCFSGLFYNQWGGGSDGKAVIGRCNICYNAMNNVNISFWQPTGVNQCCIDAGCYPTSGTFMLDASADDEGWIYIDGNLVSNPYGTDYWTELNLSCAYHTMTIWGNNFDPNYPTGCDPAGLRVQIRRTDDPYQPYAWAYGIDINGAANSGSGGGGGAYGYSTTSCLTCSAHVAGNGGSGIVIIRYPGSQRGSGGNSVYADGGYTYHVFTSGGNFTE